jgi:uncharacterized protein (UPF0335 family)
LLLVAFHGGRGDLVLVWEVNMAKATHTETDDEFGGDLPTGEALDSFVLRIEAMDLERAEHNARRVELFEEAKQAGLVPAILRQIVAERKLEPELRNWRYQLLDAYRRALGMLADTPLGEAAMRQAAGETTGEFVHRMHTAEKPRPFAEQTVHEPQRLRGRRPRKNPIEAAREHLGEPVGTA